MEVIGMRTSRKELSEKEKELVKYLMTDCQSTGDIQRKLKRLFAGTIEQMLEVKMEEHLGYEKHSSAGINTGNSRNGYGTKTIISDYGECEIAVPRDRNGEFEPKIIEKRQTRTDEIEPKIMAMYAKGFSAEGYPVKRKTAIFIVASHSFIPQPASDCSKTLPCLAAILVYQIFAVKRIYTVLFLEA
jgi:putative transposase